MIDFRMFLSPEARAGLDVVEGEKGLDEIATSYATGKIMSNGVDSLGGTDALAPQEQLFNDVDVANQLGESIPNPMDNMDIPADLQSPSKMPYDNITKQPGMYENAINNPIDNFGGLPESGIAGQGGEIPTGVQLDNNALTNPMDNFGGLNSTTLGGVAEEEPGTFLGLEGKDYTKMGMQGVLAAGVSAMKPTQVQPSKAPVGPGMTRGNPIQAPAQGVNSMVQPDPRLNSMQMTQAQGLISPFQRDRYRRGQY